VLPAIILTEPTMGENIGAAARAMKNFGLRDLRIVNPRDGWPNPLAETLSVGAADLLASAKLYPTLSAAAADLHTLYAATARRRAMNKDVVSSRNLARELARAAAGVGGGGAGVGAARVGIAFGRESSGLTNEEVALARKIVAVDADPEFPVLNLAQAVGICCYEAARPAGYGGSGDEDDGDEDDGYGRSSSSFDDGGGGGSISSSGGGDGSIDDGGNSSSSRSGFSGAARNVQELATSAEVEGLLARLFSELDLAGFFEVDTRRPHTESNIRNGLRRVPALSRAEVASMHGMLSKLTGAAKARRRQQQQQQ
jgi:tRNA/rRNA methyltransferase